MARSFVFEVPAPPPAPTPAKAAESEPFQPPAGFFASLTHPVRLWIVQQLAKGGQLTPSQVAAEWQSGLDGINKHCKTLRDAGVVSARSGADRRSTIYFIAKEFRREPGWLDYGWCRFRI